MNGLCKCEESLSNTGTVCMPLFGVAAMLIAVPLFADDGSENKIDLSATLNQAFFDAKINHADPSKRWYIIKNIKNVAGERAETIFDTYEDGSKFRVRQGIRSQTFVIPGSNPVLLGKFESFNCKEFGIYVVDVNRNLRGMDRGAAGDFLYPIHVSNQSFDAKLVFASDTKVEGIAFSYDWDISEMDSELSMIAYSDIAPVNLLLLKSLYDINSIISGESITGFVAKLFADYGTAVKKFADTGLVVGDFALYNVTTSATVAITSVTENPNGTYTFVIPTQTSGDVLRLTPTKAGRDYAKVVANTITIP